MHSCIHTDLDKIDKHTLFKIKFSLGAQMRKCGIEIPIPKFLAIPKISKSLLVYTKGEDFCGQYLLSYIQYKPAYSGHLYNNRCSFSNTI